MVKTKCKNLPLANEFLAIMFDCWKAGKIFSIQHLDLNLSQQDLQKIGKSVTFYMTKK